MTDVVATLKPGESIDQDAARLSVLSDLGVTGVRVNLGRRSLADNLRLLASAASGRPARPLLFADLPGVKGRLGAIEPSPLRVRPGDVVVLDGSAAPEDTSGAVPYRVPVGEPLPRVDDVLALDDGRVRLRVTSTDGMRLKCAVEAGTAIPRYTGVLPVSGGGPRGHLTRGDRDLARAVGADVDFLCPSFAGSAAVVRELLSGPVRPRRGVIAKIESPAGVTALPELVRAASGVMLARGDLAAFYDDPQMRDIGARMISVAREQRKIVVFASNFFRGLAKPPYRLTDSERRTLDWAGTLAPDFLLLNETAYSRAWEHVVVEAIGYCRDWS